MALSCRLSSVRGNRGKNYENEPLVPQKHTKKKKNILKSERPYYKSGENRRDTLEARLSSFFKYKSFSG
jgi:hypothetical protein